MKRRLPPERLANRCAKRRARRLPILLAALAFGCAESEPAGGDARAPEVPSTSESSDPEPRPPERPRPLLRPEQIANAPDPGGFRARAVG